MSNFPSVRPSLNLQFDSQPTPADMTSHLASVGATFSRASIGTYVDANGVIQEATAGQARPNYSTDGVHEGLLIEEARTNLIESSQDFTANNYNQNLNIIIERHANVSTPIEGAVADKIIADTISGGHYRGQSVSVTSGNDYTHSVIVKADGESNLRLVFSSAQFGSKFLVIDLDDVDNPLSDTVDSKTIEDLGDGWYRISVTAECTTSGTSTFSIGLGSTFSYAGNGTDGMFAVAHQVEAGSFPTSYIPTIPTFTSRASDGTYFDSSGVLQTASTDVERIDHKYIDGEWVEAGLLLEGASTNLHLNSGDLTGNNSVTNEVSLSLQTVTNPIDGQTQVTRITDTAVSDAHYIQSSTITADGSSDYTFSILAKAGTLSTCRLLITGGGVGTVQMIVDLSDGSILSGSGTVEDVANGWYKLSVTGTSTASSALGSRIYTTDGTNVTYTGSGEYIYVAYRQLEVGSQPTSYIATSGSTATRSADVYTTATKARSADVCYIDGTAFTDFYNQDAGTIFTKSTVANTTDGYIFSLDDGTTSNRIVHQRQPTGIRFVYNNNVDGQILDTDTISNDTSSSVSAYSDSQYRRTLNGNSVTTDSLTQGFSTNPNILNIGDGSGANRKLTGSVAKLIYFPRALSDNELIKLTQ